MLIFLKRKLKKKDVEIQRFTKKKFKIENRIAVCLLAIHKLPKTKKTKNQKMKPIKFNDLYVSLK